MSSSTANRVEAIRPETKPRLRVAVIVPALNEQDALPKLLEEIEQMKWRQQKKWEVQAFIVNDCSTDQTQAVLQSLVEQFPHVGVNLPINLGIGGAVQAGFRAAVARGFDVFVQMDADGQHPPSELDTLVSRLVETEANVMVGSRYVEGASGNVSSLSRQVGTYYFSALVRLLSGAKIKDTTSGYRAYDYRAATLIVEDYPDDYPEVEILVRLARRGILLGEVGVKMRVRQGGTSSIAGFWPIYYMVKVTLATLIAWWRGHRLFSRSQRRSK